MTTATKTPYESLSEVMPGGVSSPVRSCKGILPEPLIVEKGSGSTITDINGKIYIDYCSSWGALIHGHAHPRLVEKCQNQLLKGSTFGITTLEEERLARKIVEHTPSVEMVRFVSSGTEATMSAIRLARGYTRREKIIKFEGHYHGHSDMLLVKSGSGVSHLPESSSAGVPKAAVSDTISIPFNNPEALENALNEKVAAVILEPITGNMGVVLPKPEFLETLVKKTKEKGVLLIFDEVMTGFRVGLHSAQGLLGIQPDLTCFGKVVGGGFNAAAFGGRTEIMDQLAPLGPVYQAGTLSGNPIAMVAGYEALKMAEEEGFYEELERKGKLLCTPIIEKITQDHVKACLQRVGSMLTIYFGRDEVNHFDEALTVDRELFGEFFRYLLERGIYIPPHPLEAWFFTQAHTDEQLEYTVDAVLSFLSR